MNLNSKSFRASDCGKLFPKSPLQYFPENNGENIWLMENHFARAATYISRIFRIPLPTPWELNFISISSLVTTEKMSPHHSIKVSRDIFTMLVKISNTIFSWKLWETNFVDGKSDWITSLGLQLISSRSRIPLRSQTLGIAFHIYVSKRWERGVGG